MSRDTRPSHSTQRHGHAWAAARRLAMLPFTALLLGSCFTRHLADEMGRSGWFRADLQPTTRGEYSERFELVSLADPALPCDVLQSRQGDPSKLIIVLVHGMGGEGAEMEATVPILMEAGVASLFMLRWMPYDLRDSVASRLAAGLDTLARCNPGATDRIVVLSHSAGGVVASHAAAMVRSPITILTVASPLAGTGYLAPNPDGGQQKTLVIDLGTRIAPYPAAAQGVRVLHLRTHASSDLVMQPRNGHVPNDPLIGIPDAPQVDLPVDLNHVQALIYVARRLADGTWREWLSPLPQDAPKVALPDWD